MGSPQGAAPDLTILIENPACARCAACANSDSPDSFCHLPPSVLEQLASISTTQGYKPRRTIVQQHAHAAGVYIVRTGSLKVSIASESGRELTLRGIYPGEIVGLHSLITGEPCPATTETQGPCELCHISRKAFLSFLRLHPEAALNAAKQSSFAYKHSCEQIALLGLSRSVPERVAQLLLKWSPETGVLPAQSIQLDLTHEEIAQIAGTSRETVTRTLSEFKKKGWATLEDAKLTVCNRGALRKLSN